MTTRKFISFGNRRDRNLADVENPEEALGNLLDGLSGEGEFLVEDIEAIRGLQFERITAGNLSDLSDITVKVTDTNDLEGPLVDVEPLITIKDRVEKARIVTGNVPAFRGGFGLDARFVASEQINAGNTNSTGSDIFDVGPNQPIEKNYWERGYFEHGTLLDKTFKDEYGGIQWTGYISSELYDPTPRVNFETTGLLLVEYDPLQDDNWIKVVNLYAQTRNISVTSTVTGNVIQIDANNYTSISVNDKLVSNTEIYVTEINNLSVSLSNTITVTTGDVLEFTKILGTDYSYGSFNLPVLEPGNHVKIRISYWYPDNNEDIEDKWLYFRYHTISELPFTQLYSDPIQSAGPEEIRTFLNDALTTYNNNIGDTGTAGSNYKSLNVARSYNNIYQPKNALSQIRSVGPVNINYFANSNLITSSSSLSNSNIGDYIIPTVSANNQLPKVLKIKSKLGTSSLFVTDNTSVSGTQQVNIVDHKGLVDWFFANSTGANVTVTTNTNSIKANNVVITSGTSSYVRVTQVINSISFATSTNLSLTGTETIYIYSEKGLEDKSKLVFCNGVFGVALLSNAAIGNTMVMTSNASIAIGQVVQYTGYITESPATTVTGISGNTVSLSGTTPITKEILQDSTITFAPSGTTENKEICVIPLNTAPPFIGIEDGLSTVNRGLKSSNTLLQDFIVETGRLVINTNSGNINAVSGTQQYNRKIKINNDQYFILGANT
jgi:hypothetical protein